MLNRKTVLYISDTKPLKLCGKTLAYQFWSDSYEIPFEIEPTTGEHDYNNCDNCQDNLKVIKEVVAKKFNGYDQQLGFPFCCEYHANLVKLKEFNRNDFVNAPDMIARKVIYTNQHIINNHNTEDWYTAITEYIEWVVESFGAFPKDCGESFCLGDYFKWTIEYINDNKDIIVSKKGKLLEFINSYYTPIEKQKTDLNILFSIYEKWLNTFPFELNSYFGDLKQQFSNTLPLFYGRAKLNRYSGTSKINIHTKSSLFEVLINTTDTLLTQMNALTLYNKGLILDSDKLKLELIIAERSNKLKSGYKNDSPNEEQRYRNMIKQWFKDEKKFIDEITPLFANKQSVTISKPVVSFSEINPSSSNNTQPIMNRNINLIKKGTYSQNFPNNLEGGFEYNSSDYSYRFIEAVDDLRSYKYLETERTLQNTPIRAVGIVAYIIRNYGIAAVDMYSNYYNSLLKQYIVIESKKPDAFKRNLNREFLSKHIAEEKLRVNSSISIFDFITEEEKSIITGYVDNYFEYINKTYTQKTIETLDNTQTNFQQQLNNLQNTNFNNINKENFIELIREISKLMPDTGVRRIYLENLFKELGYTLEMGYKQTSYFYNELKKARDGQESIYKGKCINNEDTFALVDSYTCYFKINHIRFNNLEILLNAPMGGSISNTNEQQKTTNKTKATNKPELTLAHIALICYYQNIIINTSNAESILNKFNNPSTPKKIIERYNHFMQKNNRVCCDETKRDKAKHKRLLEVVQYLKNKNLEHESAVSDLKILEKNMNISKY